MVRRKGWNGGAGEEEDRIVGNFCLLPSLCGDCSVPQEEILSKVTGKKASTRMFCVRPMFKCFYCVLRLGCSGKQFIQLDQEDPLFMKTLWHQPFCGLMKIC